MDFKDKVENNIWERPSNLQKLIDFVKEATKERFGGWQWTRNSKCKYIDIRIDMRDGGFILLDRDRNRISFDDLKYQYKLGDENESEQTPD